MPPENSPPPAPQAQQNPKPAANASQAVKGYEMQEKKMTSQSAQNNHVNFNNLLLIALFMGMYVYGFFKPQQKR